VFRCKKCGNTTNFYGIWTEEYAGRITQYEDELEVEVSDNEYVEDSTSDVQILNCSECGSEDIEEVEGP
jgi:DNA-directed RNA polymerase subunit M/transcription elongation factor TFIIS